MSGDQPKRIMLKSTVKRIAIMDALAEQSGLDRHDILNTLMFDWIIKQVDQDLHKPIKDIFGY